MERRVLRKNAIVHPLRSEHVNQCASLYSLMQELRFVPSIPSTLPMLANPSGEVLRSFCGLGQSPQTLAQALGIGLRQEPVGILVRALPDRQRRLQRPMT